MPIAHYGVLKAHPHQGARGGASPHYQIWVIDEHKVNYRLAVNAQSQTQPLDLQYYIKTDFQHPITTQLTQHLSTGFTNLSSKPGGLALDYLRGDLFPLDQVQQLFQTAAEQALENLLDAQLQLALADPASLVYAFGQKWPTTRQKDTPFDFTPDQGVHDIHMNQADSAPGFTSENGPWQDGALFLYLPTQETWTAIFLKFQSQSWSTSPGARDLI